MHGSTLKVYFNLGSRVSDSDVPCLFFRKSELFMSIFEFLFIGPEISTYPFSSSSICDTVTCQENSDCVDQGSYATCICRQGYDWAPNEKCVG